MALTFKQFTIDEDHIVTLGPLAGPDNPAYGMTMGNEWHDELNDELAAAFEFPILSPDIGYRRVQELFATVGLHVPLFANPLDSGDGEHIFMISGTPPWFLYTAYFMLDNGTYEFYAEIMSEDILNDILSIDEEDSPVDT